MDIQLTIPILDPDPSFFVDIIPSLQSQTLRPNILLINSGSPIIEGNYDILTIDKQEFNHANTRNLALHYDADYYLFMTQDATPVDTSLIEKLLQAFNDPEVVVSYARQIPYGDADPIECFARKTNYPPQSCTKSQKNLPQLGIKTFFNSNSCAMYQGDYFRKVNGFKKDLNTNEDMEFAARAIIAGKKIFYCAEATVYHSHNFNFLQTWQRYLTIGEFFKHNPWIINEISHYQKTESTGLKQALHEIKHLAKTTPHYLPKSFLSSIIKFIAFKWGLKAQ